jgi:hypothetical protein
VVTAEKQPAQFAHTVEKLRQGAAEKAATEAVAAPLRDTGVTIIDQPRCPMQPQSSIGSASPSRTTRSAPAMMRTSKKSRLPRRRERQARCRGRRRSELHPSDEQLRSGLRLYRAREVRARASTVGGVSTPSELNRDPRDEPVMTETVTAVYVGGSWYDVEAGSFEVKSVYYMSPPAARRHKISCGTHMSLGFVFVDAHSGQAIAGPLTSVQAFHYTRLDVETEPSGL